MKKYPFQCSENYAAFMETNKRLINDRDSMAIGILGGDPGSGKSCRAMEMMHVISGEKAGMSKIAFTKQELLDAVDISKKEVIIVDEGLNVFFSRGAMTREGREISQFMGEIRQNNLLVLICCWDLLSIDRMIMRQAKFICYIWENRVVIRGESCTIKGNMEIYPVMGDRNYKAEYMTWLKLRDSNPLYHAKRPEAPLREKGSVYREGEKEGFYCVDKEEYKKRKEGVRKSHRNAFKRKTPNREIDFKKMDKLIKAGLPQKEIGDICEASVRIIQMRARELRKHRKKKGGYRVNVTK